MKKLKEIMVAAVAVAMVISVPVYASENDKFSDGGIAEQMEVFPAGELTGDAFDDGTEIVSEMSDVSSETAAFAETADGFRIGSSGASFVAKNAQ